MTNVYRLLFFISTALGTFPFLWYFVVSFEQGKGTHPDLCSRYLGVSGSEGLDDFSSKMHFFPPHVTCVDPRSGELSVHLFPVNWLLLAWIVAVFALVKGVLAHLEAAAGQSTDPDAQHAALVMRTARSAVATWLVSASMIPAGILLLALGQAVYSLAVLGLAVIVLFAAAVVFCAGWVRSGDPMRNDSPKSWIATGY